MQANLRSLLAGKREAVELPPKRGPGRPPKVRKTEEDAALEALQRMQDDPQSYDEHLRVRHRKRKAEGPQRMQDEAAGSSITALEEAFGKPLGEMRMPGNHERNTMHEGPQVKLQLCQWFEKTLEGLGGSDESRELVVKAVSERWDLQVSEVVKILGQKATWAQQCEDRGVTSIGLKRDEAHLPRYLRKSKRCKGTVRRAKGGGRKDKLRFLYPLVKDFFETMRQHGKYIDAVDLEDYLQHTMQRYLDEAGKLGVAETIEAGSKAQQRLDEVKAD